jgi:hypothetical protein
MMLMVMLPLVSLGSYLERSLGLGLFVLLMSMAEQDVNRFWDGATWIRLVFGQMANQIGSKQEFELPWKKMTEVCVLMELRF